MSYPITQPFVLPSAPHFFTDLHGQVVSEHIAVLESEQGAPEHGKTKGYGRWNEGQAAESLQVLECDLHSTQD